MLPCCSPRLMLWVQSCFYSDKNFWTKPNCSSNSQWSFCSFSDMRIWTEGKAIECKWSQNMCANRDVLERVFYLNKECWKFERSKNTMYCNWQYLKPNIKNFFVVCKTWYTTLRHRILWNYNGCSNAAN